MKNPVKFKFVIMTDPYGYVVKVTDLKILEKYGPLQSRTMANSAEKYFIDGDSNELKTDGIWGENLNCLDQFLISVFAPQSGSQTSGSSALTSN